MSESLQISNFGQIKEANIEFGDFTVFVGPQATGKSIAFQLFKLIKDIGHIKEEFGRYGLIWRRQIKDIFEIYFGEGMSHLWKPGQSKIRYNQELIKMDELIQRRKTKNGSVFLIPAQRVLTLREGWPKSFTEYSQADPFAVREFSETLRMIMEEEIGEGQMLFPQSRRLKQPIRDMLDKNIFSGFGLKLDKRRYQKRLILQQKNEALPYMTWSAGQREFVPLLLGLYWLLPPARTAKKKNIDWVIIEELEMGLHPQGISAVLLLVLDLIARGYKVCLSTHSPHVLDLVWALQIFKKYNGQPRSFLKIFEIQPSQTMLNMIQTVLQKEAKVFYFNRATGRTIDISDLDPGSSATDEAGWGGLSEFSGRIANIIAEVIPDENNG